MKYSLEVWVLWVKYSCFADYFCLFLSEGNTFIGVIFTPLCVRLHLKCILYSTIINLPSISQKWSFLSYFFNLSSLFLSFFNHLSFLISFPFLFFCPSLFSFLHYFFLFLPNYLCFSSLLPPFLSCFLLSLFLFIHLHRRNFNFHNTDRDQSSQVHLLIYS